MEREEKRTWTEEDNARDASTNCSGSTALRGMEAYTIVSACERNGRYINTNSAIISIWYWEECLVHNSVGIVQQKSPECTN